MTDKPINWTEPLELICDGTPLVFYDPDSPADEDGDYCLMRVDGLPFASGLSALIVNPEGKHYTYCGPDDPVLVRNRVQMDASGDAAKDTPGSASDSMAPLLAAMGNPTREPRETLRDKFAMAALTGLLAAGRGSSAYEVATLAAHYADAMMAERDKGGEA